MYRLIYKSRSKLPVDWALLDSILGSSDENNTERDITGMLVATRTHFLQVLEGSFDSVNALFYEIAKDPRHDELQLVSFSSIERRAFSEWTMHVVGMFDFHSVLVRQLKKAFGEEGGEIRLPVDEWEVAALIQEILHAHT